MSPICQGPVRIRYDTLNLVPSSPLRVARVSVNPPHILPHFRFYRFQEEIVDRIHCVGENQFRPSHNS